MLCNFFAFGDSSSDVFLLCCLLEGSLSHTSMVAGKVGEATPLSTRVNVTAGLCLRPCRRRLPALHHQLVEPHLIRQRHHGARW